jgi:PTS system nitrogen regulatory IIA component
MVISEVLREDLIIFDLKSRTKNEAILELAEKFRASGHVTDMETYIKAVMAREELSSTGLGMGLAIPHGKSAAVSTAGLAFGRSSAGIDYQAEDGEPVHLLFLIAAPATKADEHLMILANVSRKLIHASVREKLMAAKTAQEVYEAFN